MKAKDQISHFLLYANSYSRELLEDYIVQYQLSDYELINIGLEFSETSQFCCVSASWYSTSLLSSRLYSLVKKRVKSGQCINIVVPCTNHLMAGMLIGLAKKNPQTVHVDHVAEGTLNYCRRTYAKGEFTFPVIYRLIIARLFKKFISFTLGFPYKLSFADNVNVVFASSALLCRKKEGLVTNAKEIKVIQPNYNGFRLDNLSVDVSPTLVIVGSHIIESYLGVGVYDRESFLKPLADRLISLPIDFSNLNVVYLPHPRSMQNGVVELTDVYAYLNPTRVTYANGAKAYVLEKNPAYVLCLGGSTLFMELAAYDFKGDLIAWGFNELIALGCTQAHRLLAVQQELKVTVY